MSEAALESFAREYANHRAEEGRGYSGQALLDLPHLKSGPHARQWAIRARTFETFMRRVVNPLAGEEGRPLTLLDLGAGNGWLSFRLTRKGHRAIALDIRDDAVDGLGAAEQLLRRASGMQCIVASFDDVPLPSGSVDIAAFNASLHYATDLRETLREAVRLTRRGGRIAILDSPFYRSEADGLSMVAEKRNLFGAKAEALMALPFIEFLTRERLRDAAPGLVWKRHRVIYPFTYELRPIVAAFTRKRRPSRFDLWVAVRP